MSVAGIAMPTTDWRWLVNQKFDLTFIVALPVMAILTAYTVVFEPELFLPVLAFDLWILGYHHVISTYTRLCFDRQSWQENKWMIYGLMPAVAVATLSLAVFVGTWAVISLYFYWQWFHYTRQSWGVSRAYRGKDRDALYEDGWLDQAVFYSVPATGILYRSHQDPDMFLMFELWVIPTAGWVVSLAAAITVMLVGYWIVRRIQAWQQGRLANAHTLFVASHMVIFGVGYMAIENISYGWLAINIWHNAQYILFVWMFNQKRFKDGVDPNAKFLSYISQRDRLALYLTVCIAITILFYGMLIGTLGAVNAYLLTGLSGTLIVFQIVNFHHYIVDSMIWKVRSKPVSKTLELNS